MNKDRNIQKNERKVIKLNIDGNKKIVECLNEFTGATWIERYINGERIDEQKENSENYFKNTEDNYKTL